VTKPAQTSCLEKLRQAWRCPEKGSHSWSCSTTCIQCGGIACENW